jgi:hypothetical protein
MFNFRKKKEDDRLPSIGLVINKEGKIDVLCAWPKIEDREKLETVAANYAEMIVVMYNSSIMPYVQTAIATYGVKSGDEKFANLALIYINTYLSRLNKTQSSSGPVISPTKAFNVRGEAKND